jgi:predicted transcriptional regulator
MLMPPAATAADVFNAIAEPRRGQIVDLLARRGALAVGTIVVALGLPQPAISKSTESRSALSAERASNSTHSTPPNSKKGAS